MSNITNTNPLPWKHTHEKEDIKGLTHTRRHINIVVEPNNSNGRRVLLDDDFNPEKLSDGYDIATYDLDDPNSHFYNGIKTSPLGDYLKVGDIVTVFAWANYNSAQYSAFRQYHKIYLALPGEPNRRDTPISLIVVQGNGELTTKYIDAPFGPNLGFAPTYWEGEYINANDSGDKNIKLKLKFLTPTQTHTKEEGTLYFITET